MNIAIFYDALCISEDINIIKELTSKTQTFYAHFAKIISSFDNFIFSSKDAKYKDKIDIKRGGIFILVHTIRSLSLENKILNTNTIKRINNLTHKRVS